MSLSEEQLYIGLMSGTSADGMDAALVRIWPDRIETLDCITRPYPESFSQLLRARAVESTLEVASLLELDRAVATHAIDAVRELLQRAGLTPSSIRAVGSHGHTLRHLTAPAVISWQIGDPNQIAEHTGITCVADFRRRDIAAGGQGAPLVPAFHQAWLAQETHSMVLNIGGIANLTVLQPGSLIGFDTGPGNALMDEWCQQQLGVRYDAGGELAAQGKILDHRLKGWLEHDYFSRPLPKSTGRELFSLEQLGLGSNTTDRPIDILTSLTELTARSIALAVESHGHDEGELVVCGGGAHNACLLTRLQHHLPHHRVILSGARGLHPDAVEATAFAWLAHQTLEHKPGNHPGATGACGWRVLGGIFPA